MPQVQREPITVAQYLRMPETKRKEELIFGWVVREPDTSVFDHEIAASGMLAQLHAHVRTQQLGLVLGGGNVILDEEKALVLTPDIMIVLNDRMHQVGKHMYGPPNIAIEVRSPSTARYDRTEKCGFYRTYGVHEYWIADAKKVRIEIIDLTADPDTPPDVYEHEQIVRSRLLPKLDLRVCDLLDDGVRVALNKAHDESPPGSLIREFRYKKLPRKRKRQGDV